MDVELAVGQLGDNTLTPVGIDVSGLKLEEGGSFAGWWWGWVCVCVGGG
jgi:hypothetical protein